MIDITMSDDYRAFLEELNYKFTDFQTATLVWNDPMKSRQQKLTALALLRDTTKDIVLKKSEYWDHMHCNPLHLQMELPPHIENKEEDSAYRRAMEALSDYCFYKGERNTDETAKRCMKEYAKT